MPATFLLVCFVCQKESTLETRKMFFISLRKPYSFLRQSNFNLIFRCHSATMCLSMKHKHISLNNLESKLFIKTFYEKCSLGMSSRPFLILKESSTKRNLRRCAGWFGQILLQKIHFLIGVALYSLQTQPGLELVFFCNMT